MPKGGQSYTVARARILLDLSEFETPVEQAAKAINHAENAIKSITKAFGTFEDAPREVQEELENLTNAALDLAQKTGATGKSLAAMEERFRGVTHGANDAAKAARVATGPFGLLQRGVDKAATVLGKFGLNIRDVSVILGSGLLSGGLALIVREIFQFVLAAGRMALQLAQLGAEVQTFRDRLDAGFGDGAEVIKEFAEGSAQSMGLTEVAAIKLTGTIGNLFQSFGTGQKAAATFAVDLAEAAKVIQKTSFTTDTYEEVLSKLKGGLTGNVEALREYGIAVNESTLRDVARQHQIRLSTEEMDASTKALLAYLFITDQATQRSDAFNDTTRSQFDAQQELNAAFTELKTTLGEDLVPILRDLTELGIEVVAWTEDFVERVKASLGPLGDLLGLLDRFVTGPWAKLIFGTDSDKAFDNFALGVGAAKDEMTFFGAIADEVWPGLSGKINGADAAIGKFRDKTNALFEDFTKGEITANEFFEKLAKGLDVSPEEAQRQYQAFFDVIANEDPTLEQYRKSLFKTSFAQDDAEKTLRKLQEAERQSPEGIKKLVDAYEKLSDVLKKAKKDEIDAREAAFEADEEGRKAVADAQKDLDKVRKDGIKAVADADKAEFRARRVRHRAIRDARENLVDAEEEAAESIANAQEKLAEVQLDNTRKIQDAERALADARRDQARQLFDASVSIMQAKLAEDAVAINSARLALRRAKDSDGLRDAELALEEARIEAAERLQDAQENLADARVDGARKVQEAEERLAEVIEEQNERLAEARERLSEARIAATERETEAEDKLREAEDRALERSFEAWQKLGEVKARNAEAIDEAKQKVLELEGLWDDADAQLEHHLRNLEKLRLKYQQLLDLGAPPSTFFEFEGSGYRNKAVGGSMFANSPYVVGEKGPELFIPHSTGSIITNDQLLRAIRQMSGGGGVGGSNQFIINEAVDAEATAAAVSARIASGIRT